MKLKKLPIIPTLTRDNICRDLFSNNSGQHCAVGWLREMHNTSFATNNKTIAKFVKFLEENDYITKSFAEKNFNEEHSPLAKVFLWNDHPRTRKATIAEAINKFNRIIRMEKLARSRKSREE